MRLSCLIQRTFRILAVTCLAWGAGSAQAGPIQIDFSGQITSQYEFTTANGTVGTGTAVSGSVFYDPDASGFKRNSRGWIHNGALQRFDLIIGANQYSASGGSILAEYRYSKTLGMEVMKLLFRGETDVTGPSSEYGLPVLLNLMFSILDPAAHIPDLSLSNVDQLNQIFGSATLLENNVFYKNENHQRSYHYFDFSGSISASEVVATPEPGTLPLLLGIAVFAIYRANRRRGSRPAPAGVGEPSINSA